MVKLYTKNNIQDLDWTNTINSEQEKTFLCNLLISNSILISNVNCEFYLLKIKEFVLPVSITNNNYTDSYTSSIYTHYIIYALEEIPKTKNAFLFYIFIPILKILGFIFKLIEINKCVYINNFNLSTNLYPKWNGEYTQEITQYFTKYYPQYTIVFRSLSEAINSELIKKLESINYKKILSRQIYLTNTSQMNPLNKKDCKNDLKLLKKQDYQIITDKQIIKQYTHRIIELYSNLYLVKYSQLNPHLKPAFIEAGFDFFDFYLFQNTSTKKIDAVLGFYENNNIITAPIVGYDLPLNSKYSLYRRLVILLIKICTEKQKTLHWSSGVGKFKYTRGGIRHLEYSAIYYDHLPFYRKIPFYILENLLKPMKYFMSNQDF